ncbi:hypothetical protein [Arthrobacter sp. H20]|uniref:hypothetical protein n=1 Tax=Arthrobacter sp. H20 TaxID=1267981 RepID=UPI0012DF1741|nr:hypothetical protein [Arthrobacter sp. H20]
MGIQAKSVETASNWPLLRDWNLGLALGWCAVIVAVGYAWSMAIYERKPAR